MATRPNFFLGLKLSHCPIYRGFVCELQKNFANEFPHLSRCMVPPEKIHLTMFVLSLEQYQISSAVDCLLSCQEEVDNILFSKKEIDFTNIRFSRVGRFGERVLFHAPAEDAAFGKVREVFSAVQGRFITAGLMNSGEKDILKWDPHCTIAKTSADKKYGKKRKLTGRNVQYIEDYIRIQCPQFINGVNVSLSTIDLLEMTKVDISTGYYKSHSNVYLSVPEKRDRGKDSPKSMRMQFNPEYLASVSCHVLTLDGSLK